MLSNFNKYYLIIGFVLFVLSANSQNLVYNGSFEIREQVFQNSSQDYADCPCVSGHGWQDYNPQLKMAKGWYDPINEYSNCYSSSDFFHSCGNDSNNIPSWWQNNTSGVSVPVSKWMIGYQYARTGEGFTGNSSYATSFYYPSCEFFQSKLKQKLNSGSLYFVSYYTVRGNLGAYSVNTQGAYISRDSIDFPTLMTSLLNNTLNPQILNGIGYIADTLNWIKIEGTFIANGDEEYITLGNMNLIDYNPRLEDNSAHWLNWAVYAYDDVALYEVDAPYWEAKVANDTIICYGDSVLLGQTNVPTQYKSEYFYEWFIAGNENHIISNLENPVFAPTVTTTYVLKLTDFKFDKTLDTVRVEVINCTDTPEVIVYPNPAYDWVKFEFSTILPSNTKIQIFDIAGRLVQEQQFTPTAEQYQLEMKLKNLAQGVYAYSVLFDDERVVGGKLIILR